MANTRTYSIVINGVEQSVKAVDSLLTKLDALDQRIQKLQKLNLDLAQSQSRTSGGDDSASKSKYDAAKSEAAAQKEVADQIALQNRENQKALQLLTQKKQETKEQVRIQQQIAQGIRDEGGAYKNTLQGQRAMLSDLKKQLANTDLNSDEWVTLRDRVAEVNDKVKELEESYGVFNRNVGNYKSAAEGFQGFNIAIGETVRNFGSLREAGKTLKNEMMGLDTTTEEGRAQFQAYEQALHDVSIAQDQMADAAERAASSSKGLHDALEMMEGFTAIAGIGQGISSLFGLDDSGLGEQIAKLQSLMMILQSIKTLQDQMERGVGGGGWIAKLWKALDKPIASLKSLRTGLKATKTDMAAVGTAGTAGAAGMTAFSVATTTATVAVKAFAKATVLLFVLQLIAEAVDLLIEGFKALGKWLFSFGSDSEAAERTIENVGVAAEQSTKALEAYNNQLERKVQVGAISDAEAFEEAMRKMNQTLGENIHLLVDWYNARVKANDEKTNFWKDDTTGLTMSKSADEAIAQLDRIKQSFEGLDSSTQLYKDKLAQHGRDIAREMAEMGMKSRDELAKFVEALNSDSFGRSALETMIKTLPDNARDSFQSILDNFYQMADGMATRAAQLQSEINNSFANLQMQYLNMFDKPEAIRQKWEKERDKYRGWFTTMGAGLGAYEYGQAMGYINKMEQKELDDLAKSEQQKNKITTSSQASRLKATKSHGSARVKAANDIASKLEAIEKRIQNDKIQTMREGLGKTLAQLDLEKRNRIEQARKAREEFGKNNKKAEEAYQRELLSITALYSKKEFDAKKEWADKWEDYQRQLMKQTEQNARAYNQRVIELENNMNSNWLDKETMDAEVNAVQRLVQRVKIADDEMKRILKETGVKKMLEQYVKNPTEETLFKVAKILDEYQISLRETFDANGKPQYSFYYTNDEEYYKTLTRLKEIGKELDGLYKQMKDLEMAGDKESLQQSDKLWEQAVKLQKELDELSNSFDKTKMVMSDPEFLFHDWRNYYARLYEIQKEYAEKSKDVQLEQINYKTEDALFDENEAYDERVKDIEKQYGDHLKDIEEEYDRHIAQMQEKDTKEAQNAWKHAEEMKKTYGEDSEEYHNALVAYYELSDDVLNLVVEKNEAIANAEADKNNQLEWFAEMNRITVKRIEENAAEERLKVENDFIRESQTAMGNYYTGLLNEFQTYQNRFVQKASELQEKSKNAWGILNLKSYSKGINDLKSTFKTLLKDIDEEQNELIRKLGANEISLGDFNTAYNNLEDLKKEANDTLDELTKMGRNKIGEFIDSINQYIQQVGQGVQELLSTVWDAQSAALDAQQEALEKANEELDKQLQKQEDITRKHADKINEIEDELSTARGDRRQHLIDSLSAQISAQRASLAAEQRIQKQKEANEKKQDAIDKKRKENQRKQDIISATIAAALATANGLATQPFVPVGLAMGALAAALGAAQVAIISSKHYAKGGLLEGPSHAQGGIPVGNTGIEVEGKEYIVNRKTTQKNLEVLQFINSKKKKLNLGDFIEYYSTTGRKSVTGVRTKFAEGGTLPDLNTDTDWGSLIQTVVVEQDNRPIWVSVKEISDVQNDVKRVQAMAGMR